MKKSKSFFNLVRCDIMQGIINYIGYFAVAVVVVYLTMLQFNNIVVNDMSANGFSYMDGLKDFFQGVNDSKNNEEFQFPATFMSYLLIPFLVLSFYPSEDFLDRAKVIFIRTEKKSSWWYSKCIWMTLGTIVYMMFFYIGMLVFTAIYGEITIDFMYKVDGIYMTNIDKILQFIVLPTVTTIALGLMQMVVSVATIPLYGVLVQIVQLTLSMIYMSPFLPGNYYMYMRSSFYREDGIEVTTALIVCVLISFVSVVVGKIIVDKKDIL